MTILPLQLYRADQVRELDRIAIEDFNTPGIELMERAGKAAYNALRWHWPRAKRVIVLCGVGNNGGDGFVLARLAEAAGLQASVHLLGASSRLKGDALLAFNRLKQSNVGVQAFDVSLDEEQAVIVDAMLGTGLGGAVKDHWKAAIDWINRAKCRSGNKVMALDIPSGLHADTGSVLGAAVQADLTVTFIGLKQGLFTAAGPDHCGHLAFSDLQVDAAVYERVVPAATLLTERDMRRLFGARNFGARNLGVRNMGARNKDSHKRDFGHVLVVGGNHGMPGAVHLAAKAALRAGAGMVSVATRPEHIASIVSGSPELMCHGVNTPADLAGILASATCVAIGPGLGRDRWAQGLLGAVLQSKLPLVMDADALNLLAQEPCRRNNWVLTPHPGEAGRLLGMSTAQIQADRFNAAARLQARYGGVAVLKGCGTLMCAMQADNCYTGAREGQTPNTVASNTIRLCSAGNPGMATAGMGDVLTGVVSACIAQSARPKRAERIECGSDELVAQASVLEQATAAGIYLHAWAADEAARQGQRGLLASDLFPFIRHGVNRLY